MCYHNSCFSNGSEIVVVVVVVVSFFKVSCI